MLLDLLASISIFALVITVIFIVIIFIIAIILAYIQYLLTLSLFLILFHIIYIIIIIIISFFISIIISIITIIYRILIINITLTGNSFNLDCHYLCFSFVVFQHYCIIIFCFLLSIYATAFLPLNNNNNFIVRNGIICV